MDRGGGFLRAVAKFRRGLWWRDLVASVDVESRVEPDVRCLSTAMFDVDVAPSSTCVSSDARPQTVTSHAESPPGRIARHGLRDGDVPMAHAAAGCANCR